MLAELKKVRFPVETGLLLASCIFLPLVEFWKGFALLAYVLVWLANRLRTRSFGGGWQMWDTVIIAWVASAYLAAAFAGLGGNAWGKTGDVATHALLLWLVMRAGYTERELRWVLGALVVSIVAGLAYGYWEHWSGAAKSSALQLRSVGHVNHTAVYIAIMLGVSASWLFARWRNWQPGTRMAALSVLALLLVSLVRTESRAAVGVGLVLLVALAAAWWPRWRAPFAASILVVAAVVVVAVGMGAGVVRKQVERTAAGDFLQLRDAIWRTGIAAWERYPWFGVGKDNYGQVTRAHLRSWHEAAGKPYDDTRFAPYNHAHNLYVNTLAERGLVGFAGLMALLIAWAVALVRQRPRAIDSDLAWLLWGSALSAWVITCGVGLANTTLHHEHGLLAALLLGLWLSSLARRAS